MLMMRPNVYFLAVTKRRIDLHSKRAHEDQNVVYFPKNYRNVSSILILLAHCSYLLFCSLMMSEFAGPITDFPGISIDRFNVLNLKSTVYFLSHCHTDHMVGLNEPELFERLNHYNLKFFVKVSAALLSVLPLNIECFIGRGRHSYPNCNSFSCRSLSRFSNVLTSFRREICSFYWRCQIAS